MNKFKLLSEELSEECSRYCIDIISNLGSDSEEINQIKREYISRLSSPANYPYNVFPYLFIDGFAKISDPLLRKIAVAGYMYFVSILLTDNLIDEHAPGAPIIKNWKLLFSHALQARALQIMNEIFISESSFWPQFFQVKMSWMSAMIDEQIMQQDVYKYEKELWLKLASGKAAIGKATIIALGELSREKEKAKLLSDSYDLYSIGYQIFDDIKDWRSDFQHNNLTRVIIEAVRLLDKPLENISADEVGKALFFTPLGSKLLNEAIAYLNQARKLIDGKFVSWENFIDEVIAETTEMSQNIEQMSEIIKKRKYLSGTERINKRDKYKINSINESIKAGADFLLADKLQDYAATAHIMTFPRFEGFTVDNELQRGDIFQRAIIAEGFACLRNIGFNIDFQADEEIDYLLMNQCKTTGGWKYFPGLLELPPDADDLGQVLQVLALYDIDKAKVCDQVLRVLFEKNSYDDGSFETWIIDPADDSYVTVKMRHAIDNIWGKGPDVEVVANLLYGLLLYDKKLFYEKIEKGISYIVNHQNSKGYWNSTWYWGTYYGTYVCSRLIASFNPILMPSNIIGYLINEQNADGSWGSKKDSLSTALAMLSLSYIDRNLTANVKSLEKGADWLLRNQNMDGSWDETPFIKMEVGRANKISGGFTKILSYGSKAMSTLYSIKALGVTSSKSRLVDNKYIAIE